MAIYRAPRSTTARHVITGVRRHDVQQHAPRRASPHTCAISAVSRSAA
jgi:hypothetical protein